LIINFLTDNCNKTGVYEDFSLLLSKNEIMTTLQKYSKWLKFKHKKQSENNIYFTIRELYIYFNYKIVENE